MKRNYTEDEILELGRQAIKRLGVKVWVLHYVHKHGDSISVYGGPKAAQDAADDLITHRISESWDKTDQERISKMADFDDRLQYFHAVEQNVSYGETIKILECVVG